MTLGTTPGMTPGMTPLKVAVVGGNRIPFARSDGPYATVSNQSMLTAAVDGLVGRFGLEGERAAEFVAQAVLKHSRDVGLVESHEAFASQVLATPAAWEQQGLAPVDRAKLNAAGSSLATPA
ncbi:hypothetical protein [Streptomyces sp. NBC_01023]|uniref:hypothetical protein n=1 Tax=Streptomyces sp. NBC_01023 TaxID=2903724 RepID=UPI0038677C2B